MLGGIDGDHHFFYRSRSAIRYNFRFVFSPTLLAGRVPSVITLITRAPAQRRAPCVGSGFSRQSVPFVVERLRKGAAAIEPGGSKRGQQGSAVDGDHGTPYFLRRPSREQIL
jgi:hypothetical protein